MKKYLILIILSVGLYAQGFDGVVARAFAPPIGVLEAAARLLRPGGIAVLFLQGDGLIPESPRFVQLHIERYSVGGNQRKAVGLQLPNGREGSSENGQ